VIAGGLSAAADSGPSTAANRIISMLPPAPDKHYRAALLLVKPWRAISLVLLMNCRIAWRT
jgi:hypothetical protein